MFIPWIWKYPHCCLLKSLKKTGSNSSTNNMYQHVMAYCHYYLYTEKWPVHLRLMARPAIWIYALS
jgi:hypothetical protein